ncbi:hypothetical protein [Treponema endosymbiont of Eucomonympha sp.]|uniref:hypothetical protein n=1 Tax=Treponema endosymbiont of Eucomonympha sp. TaxID=1580831 RepID=UPI00164FF6BE|nr:hypothetical protein [Treponema endosymbiont of Eucomonympha sp.]
MERHAARIRNWNSMHKRFCRRRDKGIWKMPADAAIGDPAENIRMIDSTYIKAYAVYEATSTTLAAQKRG